MGKLQETMNLHRNMGKGFLFFQEKCVYTNRWLFYSITVHIQCQGGGSFPHVCAKARDGMRAISAAGVVSFIVGFFVSREL